MSSPFSDRELREMDDHLAACYRAEEFARRHPEYQQASKVDPWAQPARVSDDQPMPVEPPLLGFTAIEIAAMAAVVALSCFASSVWKMGFAS